MIAATFSAPDEHSALEQLHEAECTDGLPVVIPTPQRVDRLVLAAGLDADLVLGEVGPSFGVATIEKVCTNAVMAGCLPDHIPVVIAIVRALLQPEFDLPEVQGTTHAIAPLVIVNGPARLQAGLASTWGALGPGHRANASIGRAVRLILMNIGGARPGRSDMALLGQPGKWGMTLAEDEEHSPFEPMHVDLGFGLDDSTVTVLGVEGPHSVISVVDGDDPTSADRLLNSLAASITNLGSNNHLFRRGSVAVALNPDHASALAKAGHNRTSIQSALFERAGQTRKTLRDLNPSFLSPGGEDDDFVRTLTKPEDVLVFQAGGGGLYSVVFPSWGAGKHGNRWLVERVELDQACEIPSR